MKAIFFLSWEVSGRGGAGVSSPLEARHPAVRSRLCVRGPGAVEVGFWNATERKRIDSILAPGTCDCICRLSCFRADCQYMCETNARESVEEKEVRAHLALRNFDGYISNKYCACITLLFRLFWGRFVMYASPSRSCLSMLFLLRNCLVDKLRCIHLAIGSGII